MTTMPYPTTKPQSIHGPRLELNVARRLAKESGTTRLATVVSHLLLCSDEADAKNSITQLRHNRPEYFKRGKP